MRRRNSKISLIVAFAFFAFASIFWIIFYGKYMITGTHKNIDQLLSDGELHTSNEYIAAQVYAVVDCYAETTHRRRYLPTRHDYHYILWLNNGSFISLSVSGKSRKAELDRLCDETWSYVNKESTVLTTNPILLEGKLTSLTPKIESYYQSYLEMYGITESGNPIYYMELDCTKTRGTLWLYQISFLIMTAVTGFLAFTKYAYLLGKNTNTSDTSGMSRREKNFMTLNSYKANESFDTGNSYTNDNYSSNNNSVYGGSVYSGSTYSADNSESYTGREEYYTGSDTQSNTPVEDSFAANNPGNNIFREYYNNNPESNNSKKENTDSDKITPTRSIIKDVWGDDDKM